MLKLLIALYVVASVLALAGICRSMAMAEPRPNCRAGGLGRWLRFHGQLR